MFTELTPWQKAGAFYALALSMCIGLCALMRNTGELAAVAAMFTPFVAVLVMQLVLTRDGWTRAGWGALGLRRAGLRFWPAALLLPVVVVAGSEAVVALTGLTSLNGTDGPGVLNLLLDLPINLVVLIGFCFFEEIGWRGYLLPLVGRGLRPGLLVGFLHGLWHLPIVFLVAGAYLTDGNRWVTVPVFLGLLTVAGSLYGWLRERSGSVWPAVLLHAAFNVMVDFSAQLVTTTEPDEVALIGRETGVATLGMVVLVAVAIYTRQSRRLPHDDRHDDHDGDHDGAEQVPCRRPLPV